MSTKVRMFEGEDKFLHYYFRWRNPDRKGKGIPFACVMIHPNEDGTVHRGISICSPQERTFSRVKARGLAKRRLIQAMKEKKHTNQIKLHPDRNYFPTPGVIEYGQYIDNVQFEDHSEFRDFKSHFSATPTDGEKRMLTKPK